jgi:hypothetical protein
MRYAVAAEGSQEWRSQGLPPRNRPPELAPAGVVHALAGLIPFEERDWERGVPIYCGRCPVCVQATGFGTAAE